MTQAASSPPVEPVCRAISADTMKIPDPIIDPTTIIVESNRPRPRTNPDDSVCAAASVTTEDLKSDIGHSLFRGAPSGTSSRPSALHGGSHFKVFEYALAGTCCAYQIAHHGQRIGPRAIDFRRT